MNIFAELKGLMKNVNKIDDKYRRLYKEKCFATNPFSFTCGQTYAWVEEESREKRKDRR